MGDVFAIVSKAVFEKEARVGGSVIGLGDVWPVARYTGTGKVFESTRHSGKWLIPKGDDAVDGAWIKVLGLVSSGALLCAKVSTRRSRLLGGYPRARNLCLHAGLARLRRCHGSA